MVRRTSPRKQLDDQAFPIRLKIANLWSGTGSIRWINTDAWMKEHLGSGEYARHGDGHWELFYFRTVDAARRFQDAFPELALADYTDHVDHLRGVRAKARIEGMAPSNVLEGNHAVDGQGGD